jgi:hypothetical protein
MKRRTDTPPAFHNKRGVGGEDVSTRANGGPRPYAAVGAQSVLYLPSVAGWTTGLSQAERLSLAVRNSDSSHT